MQNERRIWLVTLVVQWILVFYVVRQERVNRALAEAVQKLAEQIVILHAELVK